MAALMQSKNYLASNINTTLSLLHVRAIRYKNKFRRTSPVHSTTLLPVVRGVLPLRLRKVICVKQQRIQNGWQSRVH